MNKISHSKYKNTGILFELLVRAITVDTMRGDNSPAVDLLKKYFVKTELGKEYKLYESIIKAKTTSEGNATVIIDTVLESSKKLNRRNIKSEKYNLIKEIKSHYDLNFFLNSKISNYKQLASIFTLMEGYNSLSPVDSDQLISSKLNLIESIIIVKEPTSSNRNEDLLNEYKEYDQDTRTLTYRILLERFNEKYSNLNPKQKSILKEFLTSSDNTSNLKKFYNEEVLILREALIEEIAKTTDKVTQIKLEEVLKYIVEVNKKDKIKTTHLTDLLQYHGLLENLKTLNNGI